MITENILPLEKEEFPLLQHKTMLSSCSQSALSVKTLDAIDAYKNSLIYDGMDWDLWIQKVEKAKYNFSQLINCDPDEVAILASVSDSISSVLNSLDLAGKEICVTELEFPTIGHSALAQQGKQKFDIKYIPHDDYIIPLENYKETVSEKTAITCIAHVCYYSGFKQDLKEISNIVHQKGSLLLVDAYQSVGAIDIDVKELGVDILVTGMQKFLMGVPGISFMYINKDVSKNLLPTVTGWFGQENTFDFELKQLKYGKYTNRFNTGTPPVINAYIAEAALSRILEIGTKNIEKYLNELSAFTIEKANEYGLTIVSPQTLENKGITTSIYVENASFIEQEMRKKDIIVSARHDVIRIAPHIYNTKDDIVHALDTLKKLI